MLHHDAVFCPPESTNTKSLPPQKLAANQAVHLAYLDKNPYTECDQEDLTKVKLTLTLTLTLTLVIILFSVIIENKLTSFALNW